jgi:hypothetical protein
MLVVAPKPNDYRITSFEEQTTIYCDYKGGENEI